MIDLPQVKGYNLASHKQAEKRRLKLLDMIHDNFTPKEAMSIWNKSRGQVGVITQYMRRYGHIVPTGGARSRIFIKVDKNANQIS